MTFACWKFFEDRIIAGLLLLAALPVMLLIALAIRLDSPGPILFRQRRGGYRNQPFLCLKFRTMTVLEDGSAVRQASRNDKRVTRLGALLRRTSLDELPQLINVLRGEMSLVGPRPHAVAHDEYYGRLIPQYAARYRVKPGITGLSQVCGLRGGTEAIELMRDRVALDAVYVRRWSVLLDLKILLATPAAAALTTNAY